MVLTIFWVSWLAEEISSMAPARLSMDSLARTTTAPASFIRPSAWAAFSAFWRVMDAISSRDEDVSSMDAACSEEPSASAWLDVATWLDPVATWSEAAVSPAIMRRSGWVT